MKGKSIFKQNEATTIVGLIKQKLVANSVAQKQIRNKIRALGFYASDFGISGGYTVQDFLRVATIQGAGEKIVQSKPELKNPVHHTNPKNHTSDNKRQQSDEAYIIDLCDELLKLKSQRHHRFDFLKGDTGVRLPCDAWFSSLNLVIEYRERQHTEEVKFFDKRLTGSGISRGEQRKKYDQLRRDILPQHKIKLIDLDYHLFKHTSQKRLLRAKNFDIEVLENILKKYI